MQTNTRSLLLECGSKNWRKILTEIESVHFNFVVKSAIQNTFNDQPAPTNAASQMNNLINSQSSSTSSLNSLHENNFGHASLVDNFMQSNEHIGPRAPSPPAFNIQRTMSQQALPNINVLTQRTLSYHAPRPQQQVAHQSLFQWSMFMVAFPFKFIFSTLVEIASFFCEFVNNIFVVF